MVERLSRLNLFEGVVIGIYGNWLISLLDKVSFEKDVWPFGIWYQPMCILLSTSTLLLIFAFSIFKPAETTGRFWFVLEIGHAVGNYGALWSEGLLTSPRLMIFLFIGIVMFYIIYYIEVLKVRIGQEARQS